ncbi:sugar ABC transporter permease [Mesotoga sp. HF07.pep.5.2.highcov]|jgi:multiple sugar transport system permease protein|uniref:Permease component of ABC-type sugar transporter n=1 Tax=Mesotoga prima MesG1.Ag.4.2 TaxID=660470 RepID=I2F7T5_9BACT|nr:MULTISPECIES: sugar ABC transporter permease [Mesotoga]AFK07988.1 permease component of ABC-type sugar transporter [Mesotoga prima MesG1.Ag.4.2]RLL89110.1 sugar ABC transporter permease [Mesotoga sp. H07pep.5.4]RLL92078.1 sugar ABC transporter permease [Mesotoga sp. HF07.pep.5.2.highcov]HNQ70808.1 sugar ABC transporter permease [Mesotoga prima]HNS75753.1 sugar ABC transporter permease [Mesotoga prima]
MKQKTRKGLFGFIFLLPVIVMISIFFIYPLIKVVLMSFQEWKIMGGSSFVGLSNYKKALVDDEFWKTLWNTVIYAIIVTPMIFVPAVLLANALKKTSRSTKIFRTIFFIPYAISFVAASYIWQWIYNDSYGILNYILISLNLIGQPINWLGQTWLSRVMVSIMVAWKTLGFTMIIVIAGLQGISPQIYEAASIDGAEKSQVFRYITLPLLRPTLVLALILSLAGSFKAFDHFYIMTKGGPLKTTETIVMYINKIGFEFYDIGFGSAVSVIFLGILLLISYLQLKAGGFQNE